MKRFGLFLFVALTVVGLSGGTAFGNPNNRPFKTVASGTGTLAYGCEDACLTATFVGHATSSHLGTGAWSAVLTVPFSGAYPSGSGVCAPATGTATLTAANGDDVNFTYTGTVCAAGDIFTSAHSFTGTYSITGGSGRFDDASGTGNITAGDDGAGNAFMSDSGTIAY